MPDVGSAANPAAAGNQAQAPGAAPAQGRVHELRVSGNLMALQTGLYCVFPKPGSQLADQKTGLPCVRISCAPHAVGHPNGVQISSFNGDGWLTRDGDAAMVRVSHGPAQVLVTVYQAAGGVDPAPQLQVVQLSANGAPPPSPPPPAARADQPVRLEPTAGQVLAHIQRRGDVVGGLGEWCGEAGSKAAVEGFSVRPPASLVDDDIEYQAVLGRGWLSPWMKGGEFCGSRGMALPVLGLRVRLTGGAASGWECACSARFADGTEVGPLPSGEACEAESLAAMEAFCVDIRPVGAKRPAAAPPSAKSGTGKVAAAEKSAKTVTPKKKR
jgi:hypothetical protein